LVVVLCALLLPDYLSGKNADPRVAVWWVALGLLVAALYVVYMVTLDVPMYISRFLADQAAGKVYLGFFQGLAYSFQIVVSCSLANWGSEMLWMALYFSVSVWISIYLLYAPRFSKEGSGTETERTPLEAMSEA
jgi:hypothetical protein